MDSEAISSFDEEALIAYFDKKFHRPFGEQWWSTVDRVPGEIPLVPEKIVKAVNGVIRWLTRDFRRRCLTWHWLNPNQPRTLQGFPDLRRSVGLDHLDLPVLLPDVKEECQRLQQEHKQFRLWIRKRVALLDFIHAPPMPVPPALVDTAVNLRAGLRVALETFFTGDRDGAAEQARDTSKNAMFAAAQAVRLVLGVGKGECRVSANLMVPTRLPSADGPVLQNQLAQQNRSVAAALWKDFTQSNQCLLIVAETRNARYLGFWIPLIRGDGGNDLPGAPFSFYHSRGQAVFKEDLPPLRGFSVDLQKRWETYIHNNLQEKLFVSIPFIVPDPDLDIQKETIAVLNVNADPIQDYDAWHRAHHGEWLDAAREASAQFVEIAYNCFLIENQVGKNPALPLDTPFSIWNRIGYEETRMRVTVTPQPLLPPPSGETNEPQK